MTDQQNVTDSSSHDAVINEALSVIDGALAKMLRRDLVSTGEVADLLLDVRTLLTDTHAQASTPVEITDIKPVGSDLV
jgi:hypothetical protein